MIFMIASNRQQGYGSFDYEVLDYRKAPWSLRTSWSRKRWMPCPRLSIEITPVRAWGLRKIEGKRSAANVQDSHSGAIGVRIIAVRRSLPSQGCDNKKVLWRDITRKRKLLEKQKKRQEEDEDHRIVSIPRVPFSPF